MMEKAIKYLKENGIEAFEGSGILIIPCTSPEEIYNLVYRVKTLLKDVGYEKSWQIDPYYYERNRLDNGKIFVGPEG